MRYISPWIYTTYKCNLKCSYCYVDRYNKEMSLDVMRQIYESFDLMLTKKEIDYIVFRIAGGEPLLVFDKWNNVFSEFKKKHYEKTFLSIITNMTILTDDMISYFKDNNCGFGISLDGISYSKPYISGETSSLFVMANIDKLIYKRGSKNIDISTVIESGNINDIEKLAEWVTDRDINWGVYLDHYYDGYEDEDYLCDKIYNIVDIMFNKGYDVANKFKFNNIKLNTGYEGCTAGEKLIAIGCDGEIWPCQTLQKESPVCNIYDIDILDKLKNQKIYEVGHNLKINDKCLSCSIYDYCGGGCKLHNNHDKTCNIIRRVEYYILSKILKGGSYA